MLTRSRRYELALQYAAIQTRLATVIAANTGMIRLYWHVGRVILARQEREGWGAKVIDRLPYDLRQTFPDMGGLSARNLKYMRAFASAWTDRENVQAPLAQLTWYHHLALIEKLDDKAMRLWYATRTVEHGWSRNILAFQIAGRLHARAGRALNNFKRTLPPTDSDFAAQPPRGVGELMHGEPSGAGVIRVLVTSAVIVAIAAPIAMRLYRKER